MANCEVSECVGCENNNISFILLCESYEDLLEFLYAHKIIPKYKKCPNCGFDMRYEANKKRFRCKKQVTKTDNHKKKIRAQCNTYVSQFKGTWFEKSNLSMQVICKFVMLWSQLRPPRQRMIEDELNMQPITILDWSNYLREVCLHFIKNNLEVLGGIGKTVEIAECEIGHKNYRHNEDNFIFGGFERESEKIFIIPVPTGSHETLLPIIKKYILPETTIISDCWKMYKCLEFEEYKNLRVNRTYNFVDPDTSICTQNIERVLYEVKSLIKRYKSRKYSFQGHIAEFLFKRKFSNYKQRLHHLWLAIAKLYPGSEAVVKHQ
ncbi:UNVERIFIED_CONTAM: hypothetical protein RMT77_014846 [Armadillidium vulgare]